MINDQLWLVNIPNRVKTCPSEYSHVSVTNKDTFAESFFSLGSSRRWTPLRTLHNSRQLDCCSLIKQSSVGILFRRSATASASWWRSLPRVRRRRCRRPPPSATGRRCWPGGQVRSGQVSQVRSALAKSDLIILTKQVGRRKFRQNRAQRVRLGV